MHTNPASELREQFLLDPEVIYLNHGSFGATPRPVFESYQYWQRELERQPTDFFGKRASQLLEQSRHRLASYLATESANLAYVTNATTGINVIAHSLQLGPDDEVLATNHEYGSLDKTWIFLSQKTGFKYRNQPIPLPVTTVDAFLEALWKGVTNRTRVIFISHITSPTALVFPIEAVCRRAHAEGIITVIDGAHAPGQIPLRLDELGADFYSGNLHKWLCAPKGTAFIYARPEVHDLIKPLVVSWGWDSAYAGSTALVDFVERQGTRDISGFLAVPDAISFLEEHHWDAVRERCHLMAAGVLQQVACMTRQPHLSPLADGWFSQMVSVPLPDSVQPARLHHWLREEHHIEVPVFPWENYNLLRLSVQGYITQADLDVLVNALRGWLSEEP